MQKKFPSVNKLILVMLLLVIGFVWVTFDALSILGPWDRPQLENKDWSLLDVRYWLVLEHNKEISRTFIIDGNDLTELQQLFSTKESVGISTPCPGFLQLHLSNGQIWNIQFGTVDTLRFCLASDNYYAYRVSLNNTKFHEKLRAYCLKNEQTYTPHARIENINICINRRYVEPSKLPDLQQKFVGEFIMIGMRGELSEVCVPLNGVDGKSGMESDRE